MDNETDSVAPEGQALFSIEDTWDHGFRDLLRSHYRGLPVLVAGADGFLGYNCVAALRALDAEISVISPGTNSRAASLAARTFCGRIENPLATPFVVGQAIVFDCAGSSSAVISVREPVSSFEADCLAQITFLDGCARLDPSPFVVFPSTRLVYGAPKYLPVDEQHPIGPRDYYALAKLTVEHFLEVAHHDHGLSSCVFRVSSAYGPYLPTKPCQHNVITQFARSVAKGERVTIFGDGRQLRDYIHVFDVVNAFLLSGMSESHRQNRFNLGGPKGISLRKAVNIMVDEAGGMPPELVPWPETALRVETGDYVADSRLAQERLGLPPMIRPEVGLRRMVREYLYAKEDADVCSV